MIRFVVGGVRGAPFGASAASASRRVYQRPAASTGRAAGPDRWTTL
jgi:hypothetical protein